VVLTSSSSSSGQDCQDKTARTRLPGQDSLDKTARIRLKGQDCQDRTALTYNILLKTLAFLTAEGIWDLSKTVS
jgi:hypothetical protein